MLPNTDRGTRRAIGLSMLPDGQWFTRLVLTFDQHVSMFYRTGAGICRYMIIRVHNIVLLLLRSSYYVCLKTDIAISNDSKIREKK